jgi:hypothetical protein
MKTFIEWIGNRGSKGSINWPFEDENRELEFKIDYTFQPGEKMVRYYKNGSGYPGSPDEIEMYNIICTKIKQYDEQGNVVRDGAPNPQEAKELGDHFDTLVQKDDRLRKIIEEKIREDIPDPADDRF